MTGNLVLQLGQMLADAPKPETKADTNGPYLLTIALALASSAGFWTVVTWLLGIRERKRKEAADEATRQKKAKADEEEAERKDLEYRELLGAAQAEAQRTALLSADTRYAALHSDYERCLEALKEVRRTAFLMLDALEVVANKFTSKDEGLTYCSTMTSEEMTKTKDNIREARTSLYQL